jgi:putative ABC transport system permease protein
MTYVEISLPRLALAAGLVVIALVVSHRLKLALGRPIAIGALRAALQLVAIGYFLVFLFAHEAPPFVLGVLAVMLFVAAFTSASRVAHVPQGQRLILRALPSIAMGSAVALIPVFVLIVPPRPWYEARYVVPISGMILSNAMNVVAQVFERVFAQAWSDRATIEQRLSLGASPAQATEPITRAALRAALIPTINGLVTVGLVALPGMMTGQILSGTAPTQAVRYQLVIVYQLVAVAAVSGATAAFFARRALFNAREQLVPSPPS